jgi:hypothetical protein
MDTKRGSAAAEIRFAARPSARRRPSNTSKRY